LLSDCGCAYAKNDRKKKEKWGKPEAVPPEENSYALELWFFGVKTYLSILDLILDEFWSVEVWEKTSDCIPALLTAWAEFRSISLYELTFLSDRGGEFKDHVKTASYHPEANVKIEKRHKELDMMCQPY